MTDYATPYDTIKYDFQKMDAEKLTKHQLSAMEEIQRINKILMLSDLVKNYGTAHDIEMGIMEFAMSYCISLNLQMSFLMPTYDSKFKEIYELLKDKNSYLNSLIKKKEINLKNIAFLKNSQINPKNWNTILNKIEYKKWKENNMDYVNDYKCERCGESKSKITQQQTRSSDEPMTIFVTCLVCLSTIKLE